jgi:lipopolysaccharide export system permease protein
MNLFDRLLIRGYVKAYLICLVSLLSLYVVVDLFTKIDDFAENRKGLALVLKQIGTYYGYQLAQIFDKLCEPIILLAAMFTVAWMQRNNELLPLLSAGVCTQRVVRPVLFCACAMLGLSVLNQELVIPRIGHFLLNPREDPNGDRPLQVHGAYEPNGIHIAGESALRRQLVVKKFSSLIPENVGRNMVHLLAQEATYVPPNNAPRTGGWLLSGTQPAELDGWTNQKVLEIVDVGKYFLYTKEVTFEAVTRNQSWFIYASTPQLLDELNKSDSARLSAMAVLFHMRLTRPILGMLLVFMGLSVILRDQNRNVFISTGMCLVLCAIFYGACFTCKHLGDTEYLSPALAAWLPVIAFGPVGFVLFDAIHT